MSDNINILLVDDDFRFRDGIKTLLSFQHPINSSNFNIVGEAESVEQAKKLVQKASPDIILLDLELLNSNGIDFLKYLHKSSLKPKVLILSAYEDATWIYQAMQSGASGYLYKHQLGTQLFDALKQVYNSTIYLPAEVTTRFFHAFQAVHEANWKTRRELHLTNRENEVLNWLLQGLSNDDIAQKLYVTVGTVKAHLTHIFEKLGVTNRTQAISTAIQLGVEIM